MSRIPTPEEVLPVVEKAAAAALALAGSSAALKADLSPVTAADMAAHQVLLEGLAPFGIPIVSEEDASHAPSSAELLWLVDPLDSTNSFIEGSPHWSVMVGLLQGNTPIMGFVAVPAREVVYAAAAGQGAYAYAHGQKTTLSIKPRAGQLRLLVSGHHYKPLMKKLEEGLSALPLTMGSIGVKAGAIAEGAADLYVTDAPLGDWDIAAAHSILTEAGGTVTDLAGQPLTYRNPKWRIPAGFAMGTPEAHVQALALLKH